jgi:L-alanine-DL-glutamate epimerase-like enolase superfamily enzyme
LPDRTTPRLSAAGLGSALLGEDPVQIGALWDKLASVTAYQGPSGISRHALPAIDIALHDLAGKQLQRPAFHLLGGARRKYLRPYATIYAGAIRERSPAEMMDATLALMTKATGLGFRAVKMEVVFDQLASDRDLVSCIRDGRATIGDDIELLVDFGYRWHDWRDASWIIRHAEASRIWLAEATSPTTISRATLAWRPASTQEWAVESSRLPSKNAERGSSSAALMSSRPTLPAAVVSPRCARSRSSRPCTAPP